MFFFLSRCDSFQVALFHALFFFFFAEFLSWVSASFPGKTQDGRQLSSQKKHARVISSLSSHSFTDNTSWTLEKIGRAANKCSLG